MLAHVIQTICQNVLYRMRPTTCGQQWVNSEQEKVHGLKKKFKKVSVLTKLKKSLRGSLLSFVEQLALQNSKGWYQIPAIRQLGFWRGHDFSTNETPYGSRGGSD